MNLTVLNAAAAVVGTIFTCLQCAITWREQRPGVTTAERRRAAAQVLAVCVASTFLSIAMMAIVYAAFTANVTTVQDVSPEIHPSRVPSAAVAVPPGCPDLDVYLSRARELYPDCSRHIFLATASSCDVPKPVFSLSRGDILEDYLSYCEALQESFAGPAPVR